MILVNNVNLLAVTEAEHIDNVFCVTYDGCQISSFYSKNQAASLLIGLCKDLDEGMAHLLNIIEYTHQFDLNIPVEGYRSVSVGDQTYVFAYNAKGQTCDIFQYNNKDFVIRDSELNKRCHNGYDVLSYCIERYNAHRHFNNRHHKKHQSI